MLIKPFVLLAKVSDRGAQLGDLAGQALVVLAVGATNPVLRRSAASLTRVGPTTRAGPLQVGVVDSDYAVRERAGIEAAYKFSGGEQRFSEAHAAEPASWPENPLVDRAVNVNGLRDRE
jgi:hypothetical protein